MTLYLELNKITIS